MYSHVNWRLAISIAVGLLGAASALAFVWLLVVLRDLVVLGFLSLLVAATLSRPVAWLERHRVPSGVAVLLVFILVGCVAVALAFLIVPPLVVQALGLRSELPVLVQHLERLRALYEEIRTTYPELVPLEPQLEATIAQALSGLAGWLMLLPQRVLATLLDLVAVIALSSMIVVHRRRLLATLLAISPPAQRETVAAVAVELWRRLGSYIGAKLTVMGIVGGATALALWPLGVPSPLLLGLVVALGELIPRIGPWLARLPLFTITALVGWMPLVMTVIMSVVIQNLKGLVIAPLVEGERLDVHPLVALLAVLAGAELFGVAGAALALPAAAALDVIADQVVVPRLRRWSESSAGAQASCERSEETTN